VSIKIKLKLIQPIGDLAEHFQNDGITETAHAWIARAFEGERTGIGGIPRHSTSDDFGAVAASTPPGGGLPEGSPK
jgi:hypothetical protein